jgi:hypothetical protein
LLISTGKCLSGRRPTVWMKTSDGRRIMFARLTSNMVRRATGSCRRVGGFFEPLRPTQFLSPFCVLDVNPQSAVSSMYAPARCTRIKARPDAPRLSSCGPFYVPRGSMPASPPPNLDAEPLALQLVRGLYDSTDGLPQQWRMLDELEPATTDAVMYESHVDGRLLRTVLPSASPMPAGDW